MTGVLMGGSHTFDDLVREWTTIEDCEPLDRKQGLNWLAKSLRIAAQLEFSTIPPYLCALWSIKDPASPTASTIRHVVQEEMIHMALALNMLVSLGDEYRVGIADPNWVPKYPGGLAGGIHPGLNVELAGFSRRALDVFLEIELPASRIEHAVAALERAERYEPEQVGGATIGEFYEKILHAFDVLEPEYRIDRQLTGPLAWVPITCHDDVRRAIELIIDQGEGSGRGPAEYPIEPGKPIELSHFYRFLELAVEKRIVPLDEDGTSWGFGEDLQHPECFPMAAVPTGGYSGPDSDAPPRVIELCTRFNRDYTAMLHHLDRAWTNGDQGELVHAIERMFSLEAPARELMQIETERHPSVTYGPDFRFLP